jgi:hypothetical protein
MLQNVTNVTWGLLIFQALTWDTPPTQIRLRAEGGRLKDKCIKKEFLKIFSSAFSLQPSALLRL